MEIIDTILTYLEYIFGLITLILFFFVLVEDGEWKKILEIFVGIPFLFCLLYSSTIFLDWAFSNHSKVCLYIIITLIILIILYGIFVIIDNYIKNSHNEQWKQETKSNLLKELKNLVVYFVYFIIGIGIIIFLAIVNTM